MSIRPLSKKLQEIACTELNEVPDRVEDDLKQIKDWLEKQPHLNVRTDDQWILNFLRSSKFSLQRAKEKLDNFYTARTLVPEFFEKRDPMSPEIQHILERGFATPLPKPLEDGSPLIVMFRYKIDPEMQPYTTVIGMILMVIEVLLNESDNFSVAGVIGLIDMEGYSYKYALQHTPAFCKKVVHCANNAYPMRIKGAYFFNTPSYIETLYNMFKPFLSEKLTSRIKLFRKDEMDELLKLVSLSTLPKQYGGSGGCLDEMAAEWKKKMESYRGWFLEEERYRSDEDKRPEKPRTAADVFGIEGSFRKLNVD